MPIVATFLNLNHYEMVGCRYVGDFFNRFPDLNGRVKSTPPPWILEGLNYPGSQRGNIFFLAILNK